MICPLLFVKLPPRRDHFVKIYTEPMAFRLSGLKERAKNMEFLTSDMTRTLRTKPLGKISEMIFLVTSCHERTARWD